MTIDGLNKKEITEKLNKILITDIEDYKDGLVISIDGKWGIGKTVFWKDYVKKNIICKDTKCKYKENDIAYVSLFGKDSIEAINSEILLKVSSKNKAFKMMNGLKERYSSALDEVNKLTQGLGGVLGSVTLSMLSDKEFKGKIICFDDFERISDNISHKDVMGLISSLKEDKKCKIVMIMHQDKMEKKNNEVTSYDIASTKQDDKRNLSLNFNTSTDENSEYTEYKEKIVDIELFYSPSIDSLFNIVKDNIEYEPFKEYTIKYLKDTDIKNIRVMKRIVTALNDFSFISDWEFIHKNSERQIVENILEVSTIYALYHFNDFDELSSYASDKATYEIVNSNKMDKKDFSIKEKYELIFNYIYNHRMYGTTPVTEVLVKYIKTSIVDIKKLHNITEEDSVNFKSSELHDKLIKLGHKYLEDYSFNSKDYKEQLYSLLQQDIKTIINIVKPHDFLFYINELISIDKDKEEDYKELLKNAGEHYIDNYLARDDDSKYFRELEYNTLISSDKGLEKYAEDTYKRIIKEKTTDVEAIIKAIINVSNRSYDDSEINLLQFITKDECKKLLKENKTFVGLSFGFLKKSNVQELDSFKERIIEALEELADENKDLKHRIKRMFERYNIKKKSKK